MTGNHTTRRAAKPRSPRTAHLFKTFSEWVDDANQRLPIRIIVDPPERDGLPFRFVGYPEALSITLGHHDPTLLSCLFPDHHAQAVI